MADMHEQSSAIETYTTKAGSESTSRMSAVSACYTSQVALLSAHDVNNVNICFHSSNDDEYFLLDIS